MLVIILPNDPKMFIKAEIALLFEFSGGLRDGLKVTISFIP